MRTTRENIRAELHRDLIRKLNGLLSKNYDSERGYREALAYSSQLQLKDFLKQQSFLHARFATEINAHLHSLNSRQENPISVLGSLHRAWINFGSSLNKASDQFILEECLRGENICIREYEEKLKNTSFLPMISLLLKGQLEALRKNIDGIKNLEDLP